VPSVAAGLGGLFVSRVFSARPGLGGLGPLEYPRLDLDSGTWLLLEQHYRCLDSGAIRLLASPSVSFTESSGSTSLGTLHNSQVSTK
jgi:hypothetical protein